MSKVERQHLSGVTVLSIDGRLKVVTEGEPDPASVERGVLAIQDDVLIKEGRFVRAADIAAVMRAVGRVGAITFYREALP